MISIPQSWYFTAHLTLKCSYSCPWCIQRYDNPTKGIMNHLDELTTEQWINGLKNFTAPFLVLSGGEVTLRDDSAEIACAVAENFGHVEIGTNLYKDPQPLINKILETKKYNVVIGTSYHPEQGNPKLFLMYVKKIIDSGITLNTVAIVDTLDGKGKEAFSYLTKMGVPKLSLNPYQGIDENGIVYPSQMTEYSCKLYKRKVKCKTSIIAVSPNGNIYPCSHLCYINSEINLGNIINLDEKRIQDFVDNGIVCNEFGYCNPCSVFRVEANKLE